MTGGKQSVIPWAVYALTFGMNTLICGMCGSSLVDYVFITLLSLAFARIACCDFARHIIPNKSLMLICLLKVVWICSGEAPIRHAVDGVLTSLAACVLLILVGTVAHNMGLSMGAGDYKYMIALSFCLGFDRMLTAFVITWILFTAAHVIAGNRRDAQTRIALAPYLSFGAVVSLCIAMIVQN